MIHHRRESCRACAGPRLYRCLVLGPSPLANALPRSEAEFAGEIRYPLDLYVCEDCFLVQLADVIDPAVLFRQYIYVTGTSETMAAHNAAYARAVADTLALGAGDLVVEIASNDGSLLAFFAARGVRTLGIEPAANLARLARARGIETVERFFTGPAAAAIRDAHGPARAVLANNVLAHVDDPADFLAGCRRLLGEDGVLVVEVPYVRDLIERREYDTIYHEHLCYFSVGALTRLYDRAELVIRGLERIPTHGGSLRISAGIPGPGEGHGAATRRLVAEEEAAGLRRLDQYDRFAADVHESRDLLRETLESLWRSGATVGGYGAPAKATTLLTYCGIDRKLLPFTVDRNPLKVGCYVPGAHIPILPVSAVVERQPAYLLLLAWNFADEIMRQQAEYRQRGGRFLLPLPRPKVL